MSDSEHRCPRCGTYLPTVTVRKPVYDEFGTTAMREPQTVLLRYEEHEEIADCIRCTGSY